MQGQWARWILPIWLALQIAPACADTVIRYPRPESGADHLSQYPVRLLEQALQHAGRGYRVELYPVRMQQARALLRLENSEGIDVVTTMTSAEREARLQPIRIPLDKGVWGLRLLLINKAAAARFASAWPAPTSSSPCWPGRAATGPTPPSCAPTACASTGAASQLRRAVPHARDRQYRLFPRSVTEIWGELKLHQDALMVEPSVVLRYRTAVYFFVRKGDTRLAADLHA
ncbi:hypothetical protein LP420_00165 [Massilia sp. B-10]|nr:hypothetical protein LP420_00165 [Massilia sp. B-10]